MSISRRLAVVVLICLALPALADEVRLARETPVDPPLRIELEELWRAGGDEDDVMIGLPVEVMAGPEGRVYLADQQLCQIHVFEADGTPAAPLGREGEGPGEVRGPVDMIRLPDGTIGLAEFFPGRVVKLTPEGEPAGRITVDVSGGEGSAAEGFTIQTMAECAGEHMIIAGSRSVPQPHVLERSHFLASIDQDGRQLVRYAEQVSKIQRPHSVVHENDFLACFALANALGPDGRVYVPLERERYAISVFEPDGTLVHVIERPDFVTWPRDERDRKRVLSLFQTWASPNPETWPEFDLKDTERAITSLNIDGRGRLWVQHSRSNRDLPEGVFQRLDLYDPDGTWRREVDVVCDGRPVSDGLRFLGDGRVVLIKGFVTARLACLGAGAGTIGEDDTEVVEIVCYRLPEFD